MSANSDLKMTFTPNADRGKIPPSIWAEDAELQVGNAGRDRTRMFDRRFRMTSSGKECFNVRNSLGTAGLAVFSMAVLASFPVFAQTRPATGNGGGARPPQSGLQNGPVGGAGRAPAAANPAASNSAGAWSGGSLAVVDIFEVFASHARHRQAMDSLNKARKELETEAQASSKSLQAKRDEWSKLPVGSPEYKAREEEWARLASDAQLELKLKEKGLREKEAQVLYTTYMDIQDAVKEYAQRKRIALVMRFSRAKVEVNNPDAVRQAVQLRPIIFEDKLDITDDIIAMVNPATAERPARPSGGNKSIPK